MWEMTKDDIHPKEYSNTWRGLDTPVCQKKKNVKSFLTQLTLLDISKRRPIFKSSSPIANIKL